MERVFSRRSFLKYTAVAAVAVAGTSLLTGCEHGENPVQYEVGTTNKVLKVVSELESAACVGDTLTFRFTIYNGRTNAIQVDRSSFAITTSDSSYYSYKDGKITLENLVLESTDDVNYVVGPQIKNGETSTFIIRAKGFKGLQSGETVNLKFFPDTEYTEYSANWTLDAADLAAAAE